jgi:hypothetical protein
LSLVATWALAGCGVDADAPPAAESQAAAARVDPNAAPPANPDGEQLRQMIDDVLEYTEHGRVMSLEKHAAWQLLHGVLAFGEGFEMQAEGKMVNTVDWVFDGKPMKGWTLVPTDRGVMATIEPGKFGQGHEEQWLAILSQCNVPTSRRLVVDGKEFTVRDLVKRAMYDCYEGKESSWTIIALSKHLLPIDQEWVAKDGQRWTVEKLVEMEAGPVDDDEYGQQLIVTGACGGTHRLIGLSIALNNFRAQKPDEPLTGGWLAAKRRIDWAVGEAKANQSASTGAFSIAFFMRPSASKNIDEHLAATGHILEFLAFALPKEKLQEPWIERAVFYLCQLLERTKHIDLECGSLYHAAHGLVLYRDKVFGPRPAADRPATATAAK